VNTLHLILDYLLHVNSNKYHLHFIVLFCPDINNLGHVGGEAGKAGWHMRIILVHTTAYGTAKIPINGH
jgi:hypothetical protein